MAPQMPHPSIQKAILIRTRPKHYTISALRPCKVTVNETFQEWVFRKQAGHIKYTEAQMEWLRLLRDFIAASLNLDRDDLELGTRGQQGGLARMHQLFGEGMDGITDELNETFAA